MSRSENKFTSDRTACDPGPCVIGYDSRMCMRRCKHCGISSQVLADGRARHPIEGDFRVICEGPSDDENETACAIGPSDPTPHLKTAQEYLEQHQQLALEVSGSQHRAKIVQLTRE